MINPRFPHMIRITREKTDESGGAVLNERGDPETAVVLESVCRNYPSSKTAWNVKVVSSDYTISLPKHGVDIKVGDMVSVCESVREMSGFVADSRENNLGANIWYNLNRN